MITTTDWKTKVGSILLAVIAAAYTIKWETDTTKTILLKLGMAAAAALLGYGAADKAQKSIEATKENTAAQFLIAGKPVTTVIPPLAAPIPTAAEQAIIDKYKKVV